MEDIAIDRENLHFRRPHSHLTPPQQRTPTNIGINLHCQKSQTVGYIFAADSIAYAHVRLFLKQSCLKTMQSIHAERFHRETVGPYLTQNDYSRSFQVICFDVDEEPLEDYILRHNNFGHVISKDIGRVSNVTLCPQVPNISLVLIHFR